LPLFSAMSAMGWDFTLRFLGYRIGFGRAQVAWGQPLLARYVPGSVLYVLGRVLLSERAGVPRRITIASIVYEHALSATSAVGVAAYFVISHPDLQGQPLRWAVLILIPAAIALLHPRVFGPLADRVLRAFGREPLPAVVPLRGVIALLAFYALNWGVVAVGIYCVARSISTIPLDDILIVGSAQAVGYFAALATLVAPAGLGIRDAAFAWAVKVAVPGQSFAIGSLIAIAVRGVLTVVEVIYVGIVTALGRREGWSLPTGVLHASPEEQAADQSAAGPSPEIL
jgi:glycosyltransferase 2 family protein